MRRSLAAERREGSMRLTPSTRQLAALFCLMIGLALPGDVLGDSPGTASSEDAVAAALSFRAALGFNTDPSFVRDLAANPDAYHRDMPIPLAPDEYDELARRIRNQTNREELLAFGAAHEGIWGGFFTDQLHGGALIVNVVGETDKWESVIRSSAPIEAVVEIRSVRYTLAQLEETVDEVSADLPALAAQGILVSDVILDVAANAVDVAVTSDAEEAQSRIGDRYSAPVTIRTSAGSGMTGCSSRSNCPGPPLRAGIGSTPSGCSIAFVAWLPTTGSWYLFTAGHCSNYGSHWYHGAKSLGYISHDVEVNGSSADAMLVGPLSYSDVSRWVYERYYQVSPMTSVRSASAEAVGDIVCLSARQAEAVRCGTLQSFGTHQIEPGIYLQHQRYANYNWAVGDSGGAVYQGNTAVGIQSGYAGSLATYSNITYAQSATSAWVNTWDCGYYC